jgi:hypothetical protein
LPDVHSRSPCGRQQHLLAHDGGVALGDRIAAPFGERREALQAAQKSEISSARSSACAPRFELRLLAHMGKPVGVLVRTGDKLAAVRVGNPFPAAPEKCTVAIFLDEQTPACQHLAPCEVHPMSAQTAAFRSKVSQRSPSPLRTRMGAP